MIKGEGHDQAVMVAILSHWSASKVTYFPMVGSLSGINTCSESLAKTIEFNPDSTVPTSSVVNSANS